MSAIALPTKLMYYVNYVIHEQKQRNIVNKEIRLAKQAYYQNSFSDYTGDSKKTWQTINELTSRKSGKKIGNISEIEWSNNSKSVVRIV